MPNLHTIQIICERGVSGKTRTPTVAGDKFQKAFAGRRYPSVRRAVLPIQATEIFHCFPEVREVYLNQPWTFLVPGYVESMSRHCPKVESFGWTENYASLAINAGEPVIRFFFFWVTSTYLNRDTVVLYLPNIRRLTFSLARTTPVSDHFPQKKKVPLILTSPHRMRSYSSRSWRASRRLQPKLNVTTSSTMVAK